MDVVDLTYFIPVNCVEQEQHTTTEDEQHFSTDQESIIEQESTNEHDD